ncbi:MAG: metal-dependent hydrolase [Pelotomaculum sp.]|nr:metal-dependent hydrolase [Pelotomaculum sp.]
MTGRTHAAAGAAAGALAGAAFGSAEAGFLAGLIAALLPDIDTPGSTIGRRVPIIPNIISMTAGHRTITHTVYFCLLAALGFGFLGSWLVAKTGLAAFLGFKLALPALAGALSHLALDACTRSGVEPLPPLGFRVSGPLATGSLLDVFLFFLLAALAGCALYLWRGW